MRGPGGAAAPNVAQSPGSPSQQHSVALPSREMLLKQLREEEFDLLVLGGNFVGLAAALDAVRRGYKVALVELLRYEEVSSRAALSHVPEPL